MAEFESWKQYFEFSQFVMRKSRHVLDAKNQRFLDTVMETSEKRKRCIKEGAVLWRAQAGNGVRRSFGAMMMRKSNLWRWKIRCPRSEWCRLLTGPLRTSEPKRNSLPVFFYRPGHGDGGNTCVDWLHCFRWSFVIRRDLIVVDCSGDLGIFRLLRQGA